MLSNLQIENIAVIKSASIDFENGFNVMTGETGAGKSIVIDSQFWASVPRVSLYEAEPTARRCAPNFKMSATM